MNSSKHDVEITITGLPKTGKTTIAHVLDSVLRDLGFIVRLDKETVDFVKSNSADERLQYVKEMATLVIKEKHTSEINYEKGIENGKEIQTSTKITEDTKKGQTPSST